MTASFATWRRRRLPFIRGIDIRLAQLPGEPAAGAGSKHIGRYYLSSIIKRIGESPERSRACSSRRCTDSKRAAILNGLTIHSTPTHPAEAL